MKSCQCVTPLHPISLAKKPISSKRTKTEEDLQKLSDLEWEGALYWDDEVGVYIPDENIEATIRNGAKMFRKGSDIAKYFNVVTMNNPLDYGENLTKEQLMADMKYRDVSPVNVKMAKILRTRPRFNMWQVSFEAIYDESKIDLETIIMAMEQAGSYVGLCDHRPKYGKFVVTDVEELPL